VCFFPLLTRREKYRGVTGVSGYRKFKAKIAEDCNYRCVYCDGHGSCFGGLEMMEMDHFRPKRQGYFPHLKDDPTNLLLSCRSCNGKKSDDWPLDPAHAESHADGVGYIDPFLVSRSNYFEVQDDGVLFAKKPSASYMIEQLALNRPFANLIRARRIVGPKLHQAIAELANAIRSPNNPKQLSHIADLLDQANEELANLFAEDAR
jgi:HNH endonuclease